jgi:hypothetical protein
LSSMSPTSPPPTGSASGAIRAVPSSQADSGVIAEPGDRRQSTRRPGAPRRDSWSGYSAAGDSLRRFVAHGSQQSVTARRRSRRRWRIDVPNALRGRRRPRATEHVREDVLESRAPRSRISRRRPR